MVDSNPPPSPPAPWGRLAVTLLLAPAIALAPAITLPGVDGSEIERLADRVGGAGSAGAGNFGIFALGVMPFISACYLVEVGALFVPRWRALRHGGPEGRARLGRAARLLALALCLFQGYGITTLFESLGRNEALGAISVPMAILSMTAGTCLLGLACELAGTWGLAGGFGVAVGWLPVVTLARRLGRHALLGEVASTELTTLALLSALAVAATWYVLRAPLEAPSAAAAEPTYRAPPVEEEPPPRTIPAPASGLAPLTVAASLLALPATLAALHVGAPLAAALEDPTTYRVASLVLLALLCFAFTWMFNAPARVAALDARAVEGRSIDALETEARGQMRASSLRSLAFLVALFAAGQVITGVTARALGAPVLALATAVALDVLAEWKARRICPDLVPVWPEHRPYALAAVREALGAAGITVHVRGENQRRLLQFFGPHVPMDLLVPSADAERATKILTRVLLSRALTV